MPFNALIVSSDSFPARADERRRLGIPARRTHGAVRAVRLEGVPSKMARALAELMAGAGGCAQAAPNRRGGGSIVILQGGGVHYHTFIEKASRREATRA